MRAQRIISLVALLLLASPVLPAAAWNDTGHQVVALIAWGELTPEVRQKATDLLKQAPPAAGLASLFKEDGRALDVRQREFFALAATWPDIVRSPKPKDRHAFSHPLSHFRDFFWEQDAHGSPVDRDDIKPPTENALERLEHFKKLLADTSNPAADRAVALAWVLHLVGDVHQPLHCSARVTNTEPNGDKGGNLFVLNSGELHSYWDSMIDKAVVRSSSEGTSAYLTRAVGVVVKEHPKASMAGELKPGKFEDWARESFETTKEELYPSTLVRGQAPPGAYKTNGIKIAKERVALGGYRLAALLEELFGK